MNAKDLFLSDGKSAGVFYCSQCRIVHREIESAESCCRPNKCACGADCEKYYTLCPTCRVNQETEREAAKFSTAEKVTSWDGWVYCEGLGNEGFAQCVEELMEFADDPDGVLPAYVWTCDPVQFAHASVGDILRHIEEDGESYEDFDARTLDGIPELEKAIEAFNTANEKVVSHQVNYKRALIVEASLIEEQTKARAHE